MHALDHTTQRRSERTLQFALFLTSAAWFLAADTVAAHAARGLSERFALDAARPLLTWAFLLFLLAIGFSILQAIAKALRIPSMPLTRSSRTTLQAHRRSIQS